MVYIEGDGRAWITRRHVSPDPTPRRAVALELALQDPATAVVYVARPCQLARPDARTGCEPTWWSDRRFAPEVVDAIDVAVGWAVRESGAEAVHLVGFSGGGVVAALLADLRPDVRSLVTVAAPLDLGAWVAHHGLSPLEGSLDPAAAGPRLADVPQVHLVGGEDDVVPREVVESFARRRPGSDLRVEVAEGHDHDCCWRESWRERIRDLRRELEGGRSSERSGALLLP